MNNYCLSSFLTFRYVVDKKQSWTNDWHPWWPSLSLNEQIDITTIEDIINFLTKHFEAIDNQTGILLSGGIDSAILAAFLPKGAKAYTIKFNAPGALDESFQASKYAVFLGLEHHIVNVEWKDYLKFSELLMQHKRSPLHAIEVALYKASQLAANHGITNLVVGNGADSTFGGMDKLLSRDWSFDEFMERYTFIDPKKVLKQSVEMTDTYERFKINSRIDVQKFLKSVHGEGIIQTFCNAVESAGIKLVAPYEQMKYSKPLDLVRIRKGESKYMLRAVFNSYYPQMEVPEKIPFTRPMDQWLATWEGPSNRVFKNDINLSQFSGDQKWLLFNLDQFLKLIENG